MACTPPTPRVRPLPSTECWQPQLFLCGRRFRQTGAAAQASGPLPLLSKHAHVQRSPPCRDAWHSLRVCVCFGTVAWAHALLLLLDKPDVQGVLKCTGSLLPGRSCACLRSSRLFCILPAANIRL